jgi:hypothetical protein
MHSCHMEGLLTGGAAQANSFQSRRFVLLAGHDQAVVAPARLSNTCLPLLPELHHCSSPPKLGCPGPRVELRKLLPSARNRSRSLRRIPQRPLCSSRSVLPPSQPNSKWILPPLTSSPKLASQPRVTNSNHLTLPPLAGSSELALPPLGGSSKPALPPLASTSKFFLPPLGSSSKFALPPLASRLGLAWPPLGRSGVGLPPLGSAPRSACVANSMKIGSDCDGFGTAWFALRRLGVPFEHTFSSDSDHHCRIHLQKNFDPQVWFGDVHLVGLVAVALFSYPGSFAQPPR